MAKCQDVRPSPPRCGKRAQGGRSLQWRPLEVKARLGFPSSPNPSDSRDPGNSGRGWWSLNLYPPLQFALLKMMKKARLEGPGRFQLAHDIASLKLL